MHFSREIVCPDFFAELMPLLDKHYLEIAHFKDIQLKPNFTRYIDLEKAGVFRMYTARDELQKLVGYAAYFMNFNLHYSDSLQAVQDVIYVEPSKRGYGMGKEFIAWCDEQLRHEKVQAVYHHVKAKHSFGPMLESLGYQLVDLIYARRLD